VYARGGELADEKIVSMLDQKVLGCVGSGGRGEGVQKSQEAFIPFLAARAFTALKLLLPFVPMTR
jgi:hypothetical protein